MKTILRGIITTALEETFMKMDEMLLSPKGPELLKEIMIDKSGFNSHAGSTANVILLVKGCLYVANAGDSRTILYSKDGSITPLSTDHKPDIEKEKERIKNAGGWVSEGRVNDNLKLSRAIGDLEYKRNAELKLQDQIISAFPDVVEHQISPDDKFLLLGCDGIWETKATKDMVKFIDSKISETPEPKLAVIVEELLERLVAKETIEGNGCDNMSAILIQFK